MDKMAWEQQELDLNYQLGLITHGGELLRKYLIGIGLKPQKETTWESVVGLANYILNLDMENLFTMEVEEAIQDIWDTEYHQLIMAKALDFLELQWVFTNIYGVTPYITETIIIWGILYIGEIGE